MKTAHSMRTTERGTFGRKSTQRKVAKNAALEPVAAAPSRRRSSTAT
jgi:hypothetical protein